jgi:hypothetical protein
LSANDRIHPRTATTSSRSSVIVSTREDFYREVVQIYAGLASQVRDPAARIADANGVPVTTVHRWVKEARRRGLLPAGAHGKAG